MRIVITILGIILTLGLNAQESMNLEKAISIALEQNFGIKIGELSIEIAENNNSWARAGKYPTVDLNIGFNNSVVDENSPASFLGGTFYSGSLAGSLDAQWLVLAGGRVKLSKEQFAQLTDIERNNQQSRINDLIRAVSQSYFNVLFQQERLLVLEESMALSKDRLEYENERRNFGISNAYNIIQFENAVFTDSINLISQLNLVEQAKRNLNSVLNLADYNAYQFEEPLAVKTEAIDAEALKAIMSEENYSLKSLQMLLAIDELNTSLERSFDKPSLSLSSSVGFTESAFKLLSDDLSSGSPSELNFGNRFNVGLNANLNWNLYDGGIQSDNVQNAKLQEEISQLSILEAKASLNNQLDILVENYNRQIQLLELSTEQVTLALRNLEMTSERVQTGQLNSLDYRNIQIQYFNALFAKANAIFNLLITKTELDFLVGRFN